MKSTAQEEAAAKLAMILEGVRQDRDGEILHEIARGEKPARVMGLLLHEAKSYLDEMGLVVVNPKIAEAVAFVAAAKKRAYDRRYVKAYDEHGKETAYDIDTGEIEAAKRALADAVLEAWG